MCQRGRSQKTYQSGRGVYLCRAIIVNGRKTAVVDRKARKEELGREEGSPKGSKSFPSPNSKLEPNHLIAARPLIDWALYSQADKDYTFIADRDDIRSRWMQEFDSVRR